MLFFCVVAVLLCCVLWAKGAVWHEFGGRRGMQAAREFRKRAHLTQGIYVLVFGPVFVQEGCLKCIKGPPRIVVLCVFVLGLAYL